MPSFLVCFDSLHWIYGEISFSWFKIYLISVGVYEVMFFLTLLTVFGLQRAMILLFG